jgi:hypothetical protein
VALGECVSAISVSCSISRTPRSFFRNLFQRTAQFAQNRSQHAMDALRALKTAQSTNLFERKFLFESKLQEQPLLDR